MLLEQHAPLRVNLLCMLCACFSRLPAVSEAGSGGQVLLDEHTFQRIKDRLLELGAVDGNGVNYKTLQSMRMRKELKQGLGLGWLGMAGRDLRGADLHRSLEAATVFDM